MAEPGQNADPHAPSSQGDGAGNQEGSRGDRPLREEVQFGEPDDVEMPALGRVDLSEGSAKMHLRRSVPRRAETRERYRIQTA